MVSPLDGCFQAIMSGEWIRLRGGLGINFPSPFVIRFGNWEIKTEPKIVEEKRNLSQKPRDL